ncbi:TraR/DksA C4-type zinc finger protein [Thalassotalea fonticola]|uniref:TraR/DksA C4-type zinc finger protein n=1 Tax=Thalassotalea fonticola TaxID=3065649 RepID=A0ABZ0GLX7_9GAMM|nr:TraR/DksA C4-type zinc finger protein [Colwelliaceae bacterium S1-1]
MIVEKLKASLITKQNELKSRLAAIENDFKKGRSQDFSEQSAERENDEVLDEIHQQTLLELQKIQQTLAMLQTEQYGICTECGKQISKERLEALPYTKTCFNCSQE